MEFKSFGTGGVGPCIFQILFNIGVYMKIGNERQSSSVTNENGVYRFMP